VGADVRIDVDESERELILRCLFEACITHADDDELRGQVKALARRLGGLP
jgi:hypothetical protein